MCNVIRWRDHLKTDAKAGLGRVEILIEVAWESEGAGASRFCQELTVWWLPSVSGECWARMRRSPGPLHFLTVYDFQVTVMFAIAMGCDVWDDGMLCSLNGDWGSSSVWHKLSCVSTMELIGWAPKADPRETLILTGQQLKGEIGALWIRHPCACDILDQVFNGTCGLIGMDRTLWVKTSLKRGWRQCLWNWKDTLTFSNLFLFLKASKSRNDYLFMFLTSAAK